MHACLECFYGCFGIYSGSYNFWKRASLNIRYFSQFQDHSTASLAYVSFKFSLILLLFVIRYIILRHEGLAYVVC